MIKVHTSRCIQCLEFTLIKVYIYEKKMPNDQDGKNMEDSNNQVDDLEMNSLAVFFVATVLSAKSLGKHFSTR